MKGINIRDIYNQLFARNKVILNIIIIILINIVGISLYFKIDLTKNNAYSLSEISKDIVSNLADPLSIKVFFSENLPAPYNSVHRYLKDMMEEYSEAGNKNFSYELIDVEKEKDKAANFGIQPIQVREIASDQMKLRNAYMGLVIIHGDIIEKLSSITEADGLEYRITTAIKKMTGKIDTLLKLDHPIKVTLYASDNLPISGTQNLDKKVADIVKKCGAENYGKVEFQYIDPVKNKEAANAAASFGVANLQWPALRTPEGNMVAAGQGFIGLVVELDGRFETIQLLSRSLFGQPMVGNLENVKDSINKAIDTILNINPNVGYVTGHDEREIGDANEGAGSFKSMLSDMYDLKEINLTKEDIPEDINTIIINGPKKEFSDYELLKIDQYIMKGRSVVFLIDSFTEINNPELSRFTGGRPIVLPLNTGIEKLLSHYGITVNKDIVLDKKCYKQTQQGFGSQDIFFVPMIQRENLNSDNVVTVFLNTLYWPKGSSVSTNPEILKNVGIKESVLVSSSEDSWLMKGRIEFVPFGMSPPADKSQMSKRNLAELLEGKFVSYFKGKDIPAENNKDKKAVANNNLVTSSKIIEKALKPAKIIVAGSSEITLSNIIDKEGKSLNAVFLHNAVDYMSGNTKTQVMRSKGIEYKPLKDSGEYTRFIIKLINIAGLPIAVIVIGIIVWRKRALRKKKIMEEFAK